MPRIAIISSSVRTGRNVKEIILAIPSLKGDEIRDILTYCEMTDAKIKIIPGLDKILTGNLEVKPRAVKPDDLLGRETVKIDENEISSYLKNKRILVTGAGGSIGSELCRQIARFSPESIIFLDNHDISRRPMYKRARMGIGYLSQEASIFRKLSMYSIFRPFIRSVTPNGKEKIMRLLLLPVSRAVAGQLATRMEATRLFIRNLALLQILRHLLLKRRSTVFP